MLLEQKNQMFNIIDAEEVPNTENKNTITLGHHVQDIVFWAQKIQ